MDDVFDLLMLMAHKQWHVTVMHMA